jgi:DNA end-binding protein Ku
VTVPVKGYTVFAKDKAAISFNQLHDECHSRIRYKKTCPIHGEVDNSQIIKGYEYGPDQYAIVDPEEIDQLRSDADRAISIDKFVAPAAIDPVYFAGQAYYLVPDGRQAQKPYAVLHQAMTAEKVWGLAQVVISNREQLVVLRPLENVFLLSVLNYTEAIRPPDSLDDEVDGGKVSAQEVKLAKTLIDMSIAKAPKLDEYHDLYNERLEKLVEAKIAGKEVAKPPAEDGGPPVINLMDALKASVEKNRPRTPGSKKLDRATRAPRKTPAKRRKSG